MTSTRNYNVEPAIRARKANVLRRRVLAAVLLLQEHGEAHGYRVIPIEPAPATVASN